MLGAGGFVLPVSLVVGPDMGILMPTLVGSYPAGRCGSSPYRGWSSHALVGSPYLLCLSSADIGRRGGCYPPGASGFSYGPALLAVD